MMNRRVFIALAIGLLPAALGACAAGGAGAASGSNPDLLTLEDLEPYQAIDAYAAIRRLRGAWLNTRSTGTMSNPGGTAVNPALGTNDQSQLKVYVDGVLRTDGVEALKQIPVVEVREIRHMNARDATMQYGTDHGAGAILVTTGR